MIKITRQQSLKRWDALPQRLREALFSEHNADILWRTCEEQHLSEDKIFKIATLAGDVIMGFIHPQDLDDEIKKELDINTEIAALISRQIERRIFLPIRSEIDKIYAPVSENVFVADKLPLEMTEAIDLRIKKEDEPENSKKIEESAGTKKEESEKEEDKPFIIHKEESAKPILGAKRSLGGLFGFLKGGKEAESKAVEAKIEIGLAETKADQAEPPKMKVIHYSEFRTPIDKITDDQRPTTNDTNIIKKQETDNKILDILEIEPPKETVADKNVVPAPPASPFSPQKPEQKPKFESAKKDEEVIDLRTMKKVDSS